MVHNAKSREINKLRKKKTPPYHDGVLNLKTEMNFKIAAGAKEKCRVVAARQEQDFLGNQDPEA